MRLQALKQAHAEAFAGLDGIPDTFLFNTAKNGGTVRPDWQTAWLR